MRITSGDVKTSLFLVTRERANFSPYSFPFDVRSSYFYRQPSLAVFYITHRAVPPKFGFLFASRYPELPEPTSQWPPGSPLLRQHPGFPRRSLVLPFFSGNSVASTGYRAVHRLLVLAAEKTVGPLQRRSRYRSDGLSLTERHYDRTYGFS